MRSWSCSVLCPLAIVCAVVSYGRSQISSNEFKPTAYYLKLDVSDLATSKWFQGSVLINITVSNPMSSLVLHAVDLEIDNSSIVMMKKKVMKWDEQKNFNLTVNSTNLILSFNSPLPTSSYSIFVKYRGLYQSTMVGFAKVSYKFNKEDKYLAVTGLSSPNARRVFPCYDMPGYKTKFTLEITVNKSQLAVSGVRALVRNASDSTRVFVFDNYPEIPVSHLGWAVLDQASYILRVNNSTATEVHTRAPLLYDNQTAWSNELTAALIEAFGNYTKMSYSKAAKHENTTVEQIVVPKFFMGTSESYGIMCFSEDRILVSPPQSSAEQMQRVSLALSKGVTKQFLGDLLYIDSWDNIWMMEGLDEFLQYAVAASLPVISDWELEDQMVIELTQPALDLDSPSSPPLTVHSDDEATLIATASSSLIKYKGGAIIRMLHSVFGSSFKEAIADFIASSFGEDYNPTSPNKLWNIMYDVASEKYIDLSQQDVEKIMKEWITAPGYPIVTVSSNVTHFIISQSNSSQWWVPVSYSLQGSPIVNKTWLKPGSFFTVEASSKWILVNVNQTGFFRVNYTADLWQELSKQLSTDLKQLPQLSRSQLIDDAFAIDPQMALQFTSFLRKETNYYPWKTALRHYKSLVYSMKGHSSHDLLKNYALDLMNGVITEIGLTAKPQGDTHIDKLKRSLVWEVACEFGHQTCVKKAVSILRTWMAETFYDPDLSLALLCTGIANSTTEVWRNVESIFQLSTYPSVRLSILRSLTCTYDVDLLYEFLNNITSTSDPTVSSMDKMILLESLAAKPFGACVLLNWLVDRLSAQTNSTMPEATTTPPSPTVNTTSSPSTTENNETTSEKVSVVPNARTAMPTEKLSETDITTILALITPRLTVMEEGTKLESFLTYANRTEFSNSTLEAMNNAAKKIYTQAEEAMNLNAKLTTWLETHAAATTSSGGMPPSTPQPQPGHTTQPPNGASNLSGTALLVCLLALSLHLFNLV